MTTSSVSRLLILGLAAACGGESKVIAPDAIPASITMTALPGAMVVGASVKLAATVIASDGKPLYSGVTWTSSDRTIADVQSDGTLTAIGAGIATITAASTAKPSIATSAVVTVTSLVAGVT